MKPANEKNTGSHPMTQISRRDFLRTAAALGLSAGALTIFEQACTTAEILTTIPVPAPLPTATRARFYPGEARSDLPDIRAEAARQGVELTELGQAEKSTDLPLPGRYQQTNAGLAGAVVKRLQVELPVSSGAVRSGLAKVDWPGRLQVVRRGEQTVLLDGAHNAEGAAMLRWALADEFPDESPVLILGMVDEKDGKSFCAELAPLAKRIVLSPVSSTRSAEPEGFLAACRAANPAAAVEIAESLGQALEWCAVEPFVVVTGSFYLVGEALERLGLAPAPAGAERRLNDWGTPGSGVKRLSD